MPTVLHPDPMSAVMLASPPLIVSGEQKELIKQILDITCSDSRFAEKGYIAIMRVLAGQTSESPTVTSLVPNTAKIGDPSFTIHVHGTNFTNQSNIIFAGQEEPTTFVSATEVTTIVNMSVWLGPDALPVTVLNADGVQADPLMFTFTDAAAGATILHAPVIAPKVVEPPKPPVTVKK